jgi:hypothetical protein
MVPRNGSIKSYFLTLKKKMEFAAKLVDRFVSSGMIIPGNRVVRLQTSPGAYFCGICLERRNVPKRGGGARSGPETAQLNSPSGGPGARISDTLVDTLSNPGRVSTESGLFRTKKIHTTTSPTHLHVFPAYHGLREDRSARKIFSRKLFRRWKSMQVSQASLIHSPLHSLLHSPVL